MDGQQALPAARRRDPLVTVNEVAGWLHCSPQAVYHWAELGQIPHIKIGRLVRFRPEDIEAFIERLQVAPA